MASNESFTGDEDVSKSKTGSDRDFSFVPRTRYCATKGCKTRMANAIYDPHTLCVRCRGKACDLGVRCDVCANWDDTIMADYLNHQHKLEVSRQRKARKQVDTQGAGPSDVPESSFLSEERESRLQASIEANLKEFFTTQQQEMSRSVLSELKIFLSGKSVEVVAPSGPDVQPTVPPVDVPPSAPSHSVPPVIEPVPGPSNPTPPPDPPASESAWQSDSRYVRAKSLFEEGCMTAKALHEVELICRADVAPVGPPPAKKPRGPGSDVYDPNDDPEWGPEPDFGDLLTFIISMNPNAKDNTIVDRAVDFLFHATAVSNKREYVRLVFFDEMSRIQVDINSKVEKLSFGQGKAINVWPKKRQYYRVSGMPDSVKVNPRLSEITHLKNTSSLAFSFSSSEALALDRALSELVQSQSFSFWLLSSFFSFLEQEDFSPSNQALFTQFSTILSSITQTQASWSLALQSFITVIKRKAILGRCLPSVLHHQKESLLRSQCFSEWLFDEGVLEKVIDAHSKALVSQAHIQLAKNYSSSSFSKAPRNQSNFNRGSRRPYSRPSFVARGRGGRGGKGRGKGKSNSKSNQSQQPKNA